MPFDASSDPYDPSPDAPRGAGDVKAFDRAVDDDDDDDLARAGTGASSDKAIRGFEDLDDDLEGAGTGAKTFTGESILGGGADQPDADVEPDLGSKLDPLADTGDDDVLVKSFQSDDFDLADDDGAATTKGALLDTDDDDFAD